MFLTKKGLRKILIMAICYFVLGSFNIVMAIFFTNMLIEADFLFVLGVIVYFLGVIVTLCGVYAESKGKLINLGNKLVRNELHPAEFIKEYEFQKNSNNLVIKKPSIEVLHLVAIAYDSLGDKENCLATVEEMVAVASEKKKAYANLVKTSILFSYDKKDEAEELFTVTQKLKLDAICNVLVDAILKSDRAMAIGDYKTVEMYNLKMLEKTFPKLDNLGKLIVNYKLGVVYEKMHDNEKAVLYYQYCANYGGDTEIRILAKSAIKKLQYAE